MVNSSIASRFVIHDWWSNGWFLAMLVSCLLDLDWSCYTRLPKARLINLDATTRNKWARHWGARISEAANGTVFTEKHYSDLNFWAKFRKFVVRPINLFLLSSNEFHKFGKARFVKPYPLPSSPWWVLDVRLARQAWWYLGFVWKSSAVTSIRKVKKYITIILNKITIINNESIINITQKIIVNHFPKAFTVTV